MDNKKQELIDILNKLELLSIDIICKQPCSDEFYDWFDRLQTMLCDLLKLDIYSRSH